VRERKSGSGLGEGMNLMGGPHPSAARERGGKGGGVGWAAAQEGGAGRGGLGQNGRKEDWGEEKAFSFLFFQTNFSTLFQMKLNSNSFVQRPLIT